MKNVEVASVITVLIHRLPLPLSVAGIRPTLLLIQLRKTYFKIISVIPPVRGR